MSDTITVAVWRTGRRYPRWVAAISVSGSRMCGNEYWPSWWGQTRWLVEAKARRWADRQHKASIRDEITKRNKEDALRNQTVLLDKEQP